MITNYKLVTNTDPELFQEEVNTLIQEDYQPHGKLVCKSSLNSLAVQKIQYIQAMVVTDGFDDY